MIQKIWSELKLNPGHHMVAIASIASVLAGLCAWQYSKGYFQTLGIPISYSPLENLIFLFDQTSKIKLGESTEGQAFGVKAYYLKFFALFVIPILLLAATQKIRKSKFFIKNNKPAPKDEKDDLHFRYSVMLISWTLLSIIITLFFSLKTQTVPSVLLVLLVLIVLIRGYLRELFAIFKRDPSFDYFYAYQWLFWFVALSAAFHFAGSQDAKRLISNSYASQDSACLSYPAKEFDPKAPPGWVVCGKLVHSDSSRICLKEEESSYVNCRQKEKYEISIIPN